MDKVFYDNFLIVPTDNGYVIEYIIYPGYALKVSLSDINKPFISEISGKNKDKIKDLDIPKLLKQYLLSTYYAKEFEFVVYDQTLLMKDNKTALTIHEFKHNEYLVTHTVLPSMIVRYGEMDKLFRYINHGKSMLKPEKVKLGDLIDIKNVPSDILVNLNRSFHFPNQC